jgi:crotonobetainyl-CoA:carnitine CoA-transferase CaiB-like acyl-CoA transferase
MVALHSGVGQVVDVNLLESLFQLMGPLISAYRLSGYLQPRAGSAIPYSVPRVTYRCADGTWVAISTTADSVAARVMVLLGVGDEPRFATSAGRVEHRSEVEQLVCDWIGSRSIDEVMAAFNAAEAIESFWPADRSSPLVEMTVGDLLRAAETAADAPSVTCDHVPAPVPEHWQGSDTPEVGTA